MDGAMRINDVWSRFVDLKAGEWQGKLIPVTVRGRPSGSVSGSANGADTLVISQ